MEPADTADASWRVIGPSWSSAHAAFLSMKPLFFSAAAAAVLLAALSFFAELRIGGEPRSTQVLLRAGLGGSVMLLHILILAPVAVAVHRFILLGKRTPGIISLRPSYTRLFALWLFLLSLFVFLIVAIAAFFGLSSLLGSAGKWFFLATMVALIACSVFTVLVFPAIAVEERSSGWKDRISASWRRMRGHFWIFIGVTLVTILPFVFVMMLVGAIVGFLDVVLFHAAMGTTPLDFIVQAVSGLAQILTAMLGAAVASHFYARFRDQTIPSA